MKSVKERRCELRKHPWHDNRFNVLNFLSLLLLLFGSYGRLDVYEAFHATASIADNATFSHWKCYLFTNSPHVNADRDDTSSNNNQVENTDLIKVQKQESAMKIEHVTSQIYSNEQARA